MTISQVDALFINEIMPNSIGDDNNQEYIEIFGSNNLSEFTIGDSSSNDSLNLLQFCDECNYSLIVEEGFDYSGLNCSVFSVGATIGNNLGNTQDSVYLYNNGFIVDSVSYDYTIEGLSYNFFNNYWNYTEPTPCFENFIYFSEDNSTSNETINQSDNSTINNTDLCNVSISIEIKDNQKFFTSGEAIKFNNQLSDDNYNYTITYWVEDYFNSTLKDPVETANLNQKQWTPNIDSKYEIAKVKNNLSFINCSNENNKTYSETIVFIVNDNQQDSVNEESTVEFDIPKITSNYVSVAGELYKGNTNKRVFSFYFQCKNENKKTKKSPELKIYLNKKFSSQEFSYKLPIKDQLDVCYSAPKISYSGLDLGGEIDVEEFKRRVTDVETELEVDDELNNVNKDNETGLDKNIRIFTYSSNNNPLQINSNFIAISQELFLNKSKNNSDANKNISQKITGYTTNGSILGSGFSFINLVVIALLIAVISLILFKKW